MASRTTDLVMPKLGLTMTEGLLMEWHVGVGDKVVAGDPLFVVETDKVASEVEAPNDGVIEAILVPEGETVPTGTAVARWIVQGASAVEDAGTDVGAIPSPRQAAQPQTEFPAASRAAQGGQRIVATPLARRLARQAGVDLLGISGTGPGGRIKAEDVGRAGPASIRLVPESASAGEDRLVEPGMIQAAMARRMTQAVREIPHFYLTTEAGVDAVLALRHELRSHLPPLRLTIGHAVVAAVARALVARPDDNRIWEQGRYRVLSSVDVAVAVAAGDDLVAPVLRGAGTMALTDLAAAHDGLVARARAGELTLDDMNGGAITVSNLGAHGVGQVFPIINPPQSLILGVGTARASLMESEAGGFERQMLLPLVLAADHRVFDGVSAAGVLARIAEGLRCPSMLLQAAPFDRSQQTSPLES